jgi:hypothetical protein
MGMGKARQDNAQQGKSGQHNTKRGKQWRENVGNHLVNWNNTSNNVY